MKTILKALLCGLFLINAIQADDNQNSVNTSLGNMRSLLNNMGQIINDIEIPLIGKLSGILPFAVTSFCLQKFPEQSILTAAGVIFYALYHNENVRNILRKYNIIKATQTKTTASEESTLCLEDDFFIFDGENLLNTEEELFKDKADQNVFDM
jgi:hypothetical protein